MSRLVRLLTAMMMNAPLATGGIAQARDAVGANDQPGLFVGAKVTIPLGTHRKQPQQPQLGLSAGLRVQDPDFGWMRSTTEARLAPPRQMDLLGLHMRGSTDVRLNAVGREMRFQQGEIRLNADGDDGGNGGWWLAGGLLAGAAVAGVVVLSQAVDDSGGE